MDFISGLCFSYRSATGGAGGVQPLQFGRLVEAGANGDWSASPLLPIAAVDASLLPVDPDDEEHAVVDGSIQQIPLLVADLRLASRVSVVPGEAICFTPVVVANEMAFRELRALFRDGMEGVFRVTHELPEGMPAGGLPAEPTARRTPGGLAARDASSARSSQRPRGEPDCAPQVPPRPSGRLRQHSPDVCGQEDSRILRPARGAQPRRLSLRLAGGARWRPPSLLQDQGGLRAPPVLRGPRRGHLLPRARQGAGGPQHQQPRRPVRAAGAQLELLSDSRPCLPQRRLPRPELLCSGGGGGGAYLLVRYHQWPALRAGQGGQGKSGAGHRGR
ncbi:hypothetical protein B484DRAFT_227633 [Ochromonadaceae sp. CCMP2298]|nr:hypothetical protein B484DRAFT_227633 [Ochromonadaceae sp. CCMP2298]